LGQKRRFLQRVVCQLPPAADIGPIRLWARSEVEDAVPEHKFLALRKTIDGGNEPQEELIVGFDGGSCTLEMFVHDTLQKKFGLRPKPPRDNEPVLVAGVGSVSTAVVVQSEVPPGGRTRVSPVPFVIAVASGVGGTQRIETTGQATTTKKGTKAAPPKRPALKGSGSPSEPSGPGASHPFRPRRKIPLIRLEPTDGAQPRINFRLALVSTIYAITELRIIGDLPSPSLLRCKSMGTRRHPQHRHPAVHARADKIPPPKMKPP
jgi:hypothetical protein